jgi:TetR/AcrR family transcriptional regulator, cholesterol catabolism regulator
MENEERIITKSHELFMRYGIRSVSMDDIAYHLGISKKTIYQSFADKEALVEAVLNIEIQRNHCECEAHKNLKENAIHEMFLSLDAMQEMFKQLNPSIIHDLQKYHPNSFQKLNKHKGEFFYAIIRGNLELGITEGLYRSEINTDILAKYHLESVFIPFNTDVFPSNKYNVSSVKKEILENFLYGIATLKGIKKIEYYKSQRQNPITHDQTN